MKKKFLAFAAVATMLAACSNNDEIIPTDENKDKPITIASAGVAELMTRATTTPLEGTEEDPVSMGVFVTGGTLDKYNGTNVEYTHKGTSWTAYLDELTIYEGEDSKQRIHAYYPYTDDIIETIPVYATDQIDYLVATPTPLTSSTVSLTMTHALTKLVLEPTMGTEMNADETIEIVEVGNMYPSGTWKVSDNTWSDLADIPQETLIMKNNEVLVIPMKSCNTFPITITTNYGRVFKTDVSLSEVGNELLPGTRYTIKLQVGQDKVTTGTITAQSWGESVDGGDLATE